jgi:GMP synthase-like glutamine amidotransferase
MKRIILIDCMPNGLSATRQAGFATAFSIFETQVKIDIIPVTELSDPKIYRQISAATGLIISGSLSNITDPGIPEKMASLLQLIREFSHPILGICFGHQLIGYAYGCEVGYMPEFIREKEWDVCINLPISIPCPLTKRNLIRVEVMHHQEIKLNSKVQENFQILASSPHCAIEMIQHYNRPLYGVQFHPETIKEPKAQEQGQELLRNFVTLALKYYRIYLREE